MTSPMELLSLDPWSPSPPQAESARLVRFASLGCSTQGLLSLSYDSAMGTRVYKGHGYELGGTSTRFSCSALSRRLLSSSEGDAAQLWVYNFENRFMGSFYNSTCLVKLVKLVYFEEKKPILFWDTLLLMLQHFIC